MGIENSDLLKETINFVETIEFSEFQPKTEIKEEEGLDQEVWKSSPFDVKPKLEQVQGQSWKTGFFELAMRDINMQARFF